MKPRETNFIAPTDPEELERFLHGVVIVAPSEGDWYWDDPQPLGASNGQPMAEPTTTVESSAFDAPTDPEALKALLYGVVVVASDEGDWYYGDPPVTSHSTCNGEPAPPATEGSKPAAGR